ncbi:MAG TPA: 3-isopropylmalate dehydratase small subunit [Candidatus Dormibacteraeota bacterium]|nr:3-isopropylmalate dehydratase small subunit [Candidatus Dormibacteraeota bacterium]
MDFTLRGRAHTYGKNVDTDVIIPGKYCSIVDQAELGTHAMEGIDPEFASRVKPGDIIVADSNFGCGSSREVAPIAIKGAGVSAVVAKSFARIFYRNAINIGLPILECPEAVDAISAGDEIEIDAAAGTIRNVTRNAEYHAAEFPPFMRSLIEAGGLIPYVERRLAERY